MGEFGVASLGPSEQALPNPSMNTNLLPPPRQDPGGYPVGENPRRPPSAPLRSLQQGLRTPGRGSSPYKVRGRGGGNGGLASPLSSRTGGSDPFAWLGPQVQPRTCERAPRRDRRRPLERRGVGWKAALLTKVANDFL